MKEGVVKRQESREWRGVATEVEENGRIAVKDLSVQLPRPSKFSVTLVEEERQKEARLGVQCKLKR